MLFECLPGNLRKLEFKYCETQLRHVIAIVLIEEIHDCEVLFQKNNRFESKVQVLREEEHSLVLRGMPIVSVEKHVHQTLQIHVHLQYVVNTRKKNEHFEDISFRVLFGTGI